MLGDHLLQQPLAVGYHRFGERRRGRDLHFGPATSAAGAAGTRPNTGRVTSTQFGILKKITVTKNGVFVDNFYQHNRVTTDDLHIDEGSAVKLTIGIKEDAVHRGRINLFGRNFGDYPQAIVMTVK